MQRVLLGYHDWLHTTEWCHHHLLVLFVTFFKSCRYVLDQEGDSWTVAFADAEDAVAFSLQVRATVWLFISALSSLQMMIGTAMGWYTAPLPCHC